MTRVAAKDEHVRCNLCGADDYQVLYKEGEAQLSQVVRCNSCGLMYANPRRVDPDVEDVSSWPCDGALDWDGNHPALRWNRQRREKEKLQIADYEQTRTRLKSLYPHGGALVEVGAGLGFLTSAFQSDGFEVTGIEPWKEACLHAEKQLGVRRAIASTLEGAELPGESVDVLVMLHVIEHVPDPMATLQEIYRVLRPGGHVVLETPRVDGMVSKLFGKRERNIRCDGHIYFFGEEQFAQLCENAGFGVMEQHLVGRSLTLGRLAYNFAQVVRSKRLSEKVDDLQQLPIFKVPLELNVGDIQRVLLRKPLSPPVTLRPQTEQTKTTAVA